MIFADLYPKTVGLSKSEEVAAAVAFGVVGSRALGLKRETVDTEEKRNLRELLENYMKTRNRGFLDALTIDQIRKADQLVEIDDRVIPYSLVSKVDFDRRSAQIVITQQARTGLAAEIYGSTTKWEFDILESRLFPVLSELFQRLLPKKTFN
jgi:hypothetical protein